MFPGLNCPGSYHKPGERIRLCLNPHIRKTRCGCGHLDETDAGLLRSCVLLRLCVLTHRLGIS